MPLQIIPVRFDDEVSPSDDISQLIADSAKVDDGDVIVVAQKIVSKQEGRTVNLSQLTPSLLAEGIASQYRKDPRIVELILSETRRIIRMSGGIIIVETNGGLICANAGVDESNVRDGFATALPVDPDKSARDIREKIKERTGRSAAVIVSDTFGRPFRTGQTNCAIGVSGLCPLLDYEGTRDAFGKVLRVTEIAVADELCSAAELAMGKTSRCPAAIVRGYAFGPGERPVSDLIRPENEDLFR